MPQEMNGGGAGDEGDASLSLAQAARLTGMPRRYLEELIDAGQLAVTYAEKGGSRKARVSRHALTVAGLSDADDSTRTPESPEAAVPAQTELQAMIELVREQNARISSLEDQRFLLAGQLGGALERVRVLEESAQNADRAIPAGGRVAAVAGAIPEVSGAPARSALEEAMSTEEGETIALSSISGVLLRDGVHRLRVRLIRIAPDLPGPFRRFRR